MDNMDIFRRVCETPEEARKRIDAGRLKGMTDINPMWRIKKLTEVFGACGTGWWTDIVKYELIPGGGNEIRAFMQLNLYYVLDGVTSKPVPGFGGASFVSQEKSGLYTSDECFKMAFTDALGSACKLLGMSADIFYEKDRSKYTDTPEDPKEPKEPKAPNKPKQPQPNTRPVNMTPVSNDDLNKMCGAVAILERRTAKEVAAEAMKALGMTAEKTDSFALYAYLNNRLEELQNAKS